jgi:hypothetical protein
MKNFLYEKIKDKFKHLDCQIGKNKGLLKISYAESKHPVMQDIQNKLIYEEEIASDPVEEQSSATALSQPITTLSDDVETASESDEEPITTLSNDVETASESDEEPSNLYFPNLCQIQ